MRYPFLNPTISFEENAQRGPVDLAKKFDETHAEQKFSLFGHKLFSPFGIPAGPLPTSKYIEQAINLGYNVLTYKTVRSNELVAHPWPNILPINILEQLDPVNTPESVTVKETFGNEVTITNSFGVPSVTPNFWQEDLQKAVKNCPEGSLVIGSFQGTNPRTGNFNDYLKDFALTAKLVKETGCKVLEVNLSCPNEGKQNLLCFDVENSTKVVEAIKNEIGNTPLVIKTGFYRDENLLENFVKTVGPLVQGIESINAVSCKILKENGEPAWQDPKRLYSGVCGWGIKNCGIHTVKKLKTLKETFGLSYSILGVGGIMHGQDFIDYINAGADAALSATGAMWNENLAFEAKQLINK